MISNILRPGLNNLGLFYKTLGKQLCQYFYGVMHIFFAAAETRCAYRLLVSELM
jgi:hypothetical protein